ncbi:hypothetical protein [Nocardiopsis ganjiahuensis]|uniref:hypothetical protein n=1 Tax=Nocardiopsis ganjiahuensis TaxID=239984 RepID=UPI000348CEB7|nr:hypothetical protein [Nocardiopsis ganjiahuensis]
MSFDDLRSATAQALHDERLRQAELSRHARRQRAEERSRHRENRKSIRPRRA